MQLSANQLHPKNNKRTLRIYQKTLRSVGQRRTRWPISIGEVMLSNDVANESIPKSSELMRYQIIQRNGMVPFFGLAHV